MKNIFTIALLLSPTGVVIGQTTEEPKLPMLHIKSNDGKFYAGIGGTLKTTLSYDFGHVLHNPNEFIVSEIPMSQSAGDGALCQVSAQQSNLYLTAGYGYGTKYAVEAYLNGQFLGDNYGFRIENAYMSFMGVKAGYTYGLFCDNASMPNTIDFQGPNGAVSVQSGVMDYTYNFKSGWSIGAGIEKPLAYDVAVEGIRKVNQRIPDIPVAVNYQFKTGHIHAAAMMRGLQYRDEISSRNHTVLGIGVSIAGAGQIYGPIGYCFQTTAGKGISSYYQDTNGLDVDVSPKVGEEGRLQAVKSWGGFWGLTCAFSKKVSSTITYSHLRVYPKGMTGATYSYGQYALGNVIWNITPYLQCGLEYIYGRRVNLNHSQAHDSRLQTMLAVTF